MPTDCVYQSSGSVSGAFLEGECQIGPSGINAVRESVRSAADSYIQSQLNTTFAPGMSLGPTGRVRYISHDGLVERSSGIRGDGFETEEGSVFANVNYDVPGSVMGGRLRFGLLVGYDSMRVDMDAGPQGAGSYTASKTEFDTLFYGGSYTWSMGNFYSLTLLIGLNGEAENTTASAIDASIRKTSTDIDGYISNNVIGYVFDLAGGFKFDLRGGLGSSKASTDAAFSPVFLANISAGSSQWNGSITTNFYTVMNLSNGSVMRPYVLATYRHIFDEEIELTGLAETVHFSQADDYGRVEFGADVVQGAFTFGGAVYTESSADEDTIGLRLGASVKFQ
ncbi:MAG: hypothetical protein ACT4N2_09045 [Hyphomicrobium sp.]